MGKIVISENVSLAGLGAGERLFGETSHTKPLRLISTRTIGDGLAFLTYQPVRDA
jgi:hypothetical protein